MLSDEQRSRVAAATVTIETSENGNGRAFLVPGGYLITAAHCVDFDLSGGIALSGRMLQFVETSAGKRFRVQAEAIDAVSDLAVLGFPDEADFPKDCRLFQEFIDGTQPIQVEFENPLNGQMVCVFTHQETWICGRVSMFDFNPIVRTASISTQEQIIGGTSGSAFLNEAGRAVCVVSIVSETESELSSECEGVSPLIHQCLPKYLYDTIKASQEAL